jgi:hypothetical protein
MTHLRQGYGGQAPLTYTRADLQAALHIRSDVAFTKRMAVLEAGGFPKRLPHQNGQRALWSKLAVDAWLANWGQADHVIMPIITEDGMNAMRNHYEERHVRN